MTKKEQLAFEYGKTFEPKPGKDAPCYDERMMDLVTESRTDAGIRRNIKIMEAWSLGRKEAHA